MGALPEDTSCEGYGVRTQENGNAVSRDLGRLGGDQTNQVYNRKLALLATPTNPQIGSPYADFLGDFAISMIFKNRFYVIKISKAVWYGGILVVLKIALFSL